MEITKEIVRSTIELFTSMVMMDVAESSDDLNEDGHLQDSITGLIGLAGEYKGVLAIHFPKQIAFTITSNFLGIEVDELNEDVEDAIGEIANMIGGDIKGFLSDSGRAIDLSLPSTISGQQYDFQSNKNAEKFMVGFQTDGGKFVVELQLEQ